MLLEVFSYEEGRRAILSSEDGGVSLKMTILPDTLENTFQETLNFDLQPGTNRRVFSVVHPIPLVQVASFLRFIQLYILSCMLSFLYVHTSLTFGAGLMSESNWNANSTKQQLVL